MAFDDDEIFDGIYVQAGFRVEIKGVVNGGSVGHFFIDPGFASGDDEACFFANQVDDHGGTINHATGIVNDLASEGAAELVKRIVIVGGGEVNQFGGGFPGPPGIDLNGVFGGGIEQTGGVVRGTPEVEVVGGEFAGFEGAEGDGEAGGIDDGAFGVVEACDEVNVEDFIAIIGDLPDKVQIVKIVGVVDGVGDGEVEGVYGGGDFCVQVELVGGEVCCARVWAGDGDAEGAGVAGVEVADHDVVGFGDHDFACGVEDGACQGVDEDGLVGVVDEFAGDVDTPIVIEGHDAVGDVYGGAFEVGDAVADDGGDEAIGVGDVVEDIHGEGAGFAGGKGVEV